jgi:hypothetical protein
LPRCPISQAAPHIVRASVRSTRVGDVADQPRYDRFDARRDRLAQLIAINGL